MSQPVFDQDRAARNAVLDAFLIFAGGMISTTLMDVLMHVFEHKHLMNYAGVFGFWLLQAMIGIIGGMFCYVVKFATETKRAGKVRSVWRSIVATVLTILATGTAVYVTIGVVINGNSFSIKEIPLACALFGFPLMPLGYRVFGFKRSKRPGTKLGAELRDARLRGTTRD